MSWGGRQPERGHPATGGANEVYMGNGVLTGRCA